MNFSRALEGIKEGKRARRSGWADSENRVLVMIVDENDKRPFIGRILLDTHAVTPWIGGRNDLLADDWVLDTHL